jgi:hypothetical protein
MSLEEVMSRVDWLVQLHQSEVGARLRVRQILNGGSDGIRALLGDAVTEVSELMPIPPLMHSGLKRIAQKIGGNIPDLKVDPYGYKDSTRSKKVAEKIERVVDSYDHGCRLELQLPQVGRWLPGYGFAVWVVKDRSAPDGTRFPYLQLRDPFDVYPGPWSVDQQPEEMAVLSRVTIADLIRLYPERAGAIQAAATDNRPTARGGAVLLGVGTHSWANPSGEGVVVAEYWYPEGTWVIVPEWGLELSFVPNPLQRNRFYVAKRFAFDRLVGHYDHIVGLLAQMTRISVLEYIHLEDSVFTETNVYGESLEGDKYRKGRNSVNRFASGTRVEKPLNNLPYQMFQGIDRIERLLRVGSSYPVSDDGQSPNSFVTGRGLDALRQDVDLEISEYQKVLRWALQDLDSLRLEWDEVRNGGTSRGLVGYRNGSTYSEQYDPAKDIAGRYRTRRVYGIMAGWDEPSKIVTGLQLDQGEIIDKQTFQENLSGLENITQVNERIRARKAEETAWAMLLQEANTPDQPGLPPNPAKAKAQMAVIEVMREPSRFQEILDKFYTEKGEEISPEEQQAIDGGPPELPFGPDPSISTALSRLEADGEIGAGIQTVGRI